MGEYFNEKFLDTTIDDYSTNISKDGAQKKLCVWYLQIIKSDSRNFGIQLLKR